MKKILIPGFFILGVIVCFFGMRIFQPRCQTYPCFPDKYKYEAIMKPKDFFERMKVSGQSPTFAAPKTMIMCCDDKFFKIITEKYKTKQCDGRFEKVYFLTDYPSVAIAKLGWTAANAVISFELFIAWGIKQAIFIGTSCAIQKDITLGDLIVCEKAIRDEGLSHHYLAQDKYACPSQMLQKKLLSTLNGINKPYRLGTVWTIGAFHRATVPEVERYQKEGVLSVEMEMAGLFSVAQYYHIDIVAMSTVTDSYANLKWEKAHDYEAKKLKALEEFFEIALKVAAQ
jgi:purine-nucleoside phosphorylase